MAQIRDPRRRQILLVCGCPRSGTTAFTHILNGHSQVVIGYEIFGDYESYIDRFYPTLFSSPAFLNGLSRVPRLLERFSDASIVGDKVPIYHAKLPEIVSQIPDVKILAIIRHPRDVAISFQMRFRDPADWWDQDFQASFGFYNRAAKDIAGALHAGLPIHVVEYETLLAGNVDYLRKIFSLIDLDLEQPLIEEYNNVCKIGEENFTRHSRVKIDGIDEMVETMIDHELIHDIHANCI